MKETFTSYQSSSKLNQVVYTTQKRLILASVVIVVSLIFLIRGVMSYRFDVAHSSSAIGTEMLFERSNAKVTLSDIYVTENQDALIARLSLKEDAEYNLPYKGTDFGAYLYSENLTDYAGQWADIVFAKLSTTGDYFFVIPYPDPSTVYTIMLMNRNYIAVSSQDTQNGAAETSPSLSQANIEKDLTAQLSKQKYQLDDAQSLTPKIASDDYDVISMRLTIEPSLEGDEFKPKPLKTQFFNEQKQPQFANLFEAVYKQSLLQSAANEFSQTQQQLNTLQTQKAELSERLKTNPTNETLNQQMQETLTQEEGLKTRMRETMQKQQFYQTIQYDPATMFQSPLYSAYVLGGLE